jgi:hypothetical protein
LALKEPLIFIKLIWSLLDFELCPVFLRIFYNEAFRKLDLLPSSDGAAGETFSAVYLRKSEPQALIPIDPHLRTETEPAPEMLRP